VREGSPESAINTYLKKDGWWEISAVLDWVCFRTELVTDTTNRMNQAPAKCLVHFAA